MYTQIAHIICPSFIVCGNSSWKMVALRMVLLGNSSFDHRIVGKWLGSKDPQIRTVSETDFEKLTVGPLFGPIPLLANSRVVFCSVCSLGLNFRQQLIIVCSPILSYLGTVSQENKTVTGVQKMVNKELQCKQFHLATFRTGVMTSILIIFFSHCTLMITKSIRVF